MNSEITPLFLANICKERTKWLKKWSTEDVKLRERDLRTALWFHYRADDYGSMFKRGEFLKTNSFNNFTNYGLKKYLKIGWIRCVYKAPLGSKNSDKYCATPKLISMVNKLYRLSVKNPLGLEKDSSALREKMKQIYSFRDKKPIIPFLVYHDQIRVCFQNRYKVNNWDFELLFWLHYITVYKGFYTREDYMKIGYWRSKRYEDYIERGWVEIVDPKKKHYKVTTKFKMIAARIYRQCLGHERLGETERANPTLKNKYEAPSILNILCDENFYKDESK